MTIKWFSQSEHINNKMLKNVAYEPLYMVKLYKRNYVNEYKFYTVGHGEY